MDALSRKTRSIIRRGVRADQPAATDVLEGTLYYVTDELVLERSNGSAWESNSLDFVEAAWTPVVQGDTGGSGVTYSQQDGYSLKIGKMVYLTLDVALTSAGTLTGTWLNITGLPYEQNASGVGLARFNNLRGEPNAQFLAMQIFGGDAVRLWFEFMDGTASPLIGDVENNMVVTATMHYTTDD